MYMIIMRYPLLSCQVTSKLRNRRSILATCLNTISTYDIFLIVRSMTFQFKSSVFWSFVQYFIVWPWMQLPMPLLACDNVYQLITAGCGFLHTQTKPRLWMTARLSLSLDLHDLAGLSTSLHVYQSCNGSDVGFSRDFVLMVFSLVFFPWVGVWTWHHP